MKKFLRGLVKEVNKDKKTVRVVASTGAVDREGETLNPNGWDFSNFLKNPQLLWSHDAFSPPIGRVTRVWTENGVVMADTEFAEEESEFAGLIARLVRGGYINAVSVGFMPLDMDPTTGQVNSQELLELSYVNIPANQEALVMQRGGEGADLVKKLRVLETKMLGDANGKKGSENLPEKKADDGKKAMSDEMGQMATELGSHLSAMQQMMPKLTDAIDGDDATAANDIMSQMRTHMTQMADLMEGMSGMIGGKELKAFADLREKVGRVISETNRNEIRLMVDACKQAADAGQKLLDATTPEKKGGIPNRKAVDSPSAKLRALRIVDRAVEILIQGEKEAQSRETKGGAEN